jgi:hypothetical protein
MYKALILLMVGLVGGAELAHISYHRQLDGDPHSYCLGRFPELR